MVRQHEGRVVIRRVRAPEAGPRVRAPRAGAAAEHVPSHHGRADVLEPALDDRTARVDLAALLSLQLAEGPERKEPFVQLHAAETERVLRALLRAGGVAVERHHHVDPELARWIPPVQLPWWSSRISDTRPGSSSAAKCPVLGSETDRACRSRATFASRSEGRDQSRSPYTRVAGTLTRS